MFVSCKICHFKVLFFAQWFKPSFTYYCFFCHLIICVNEMLYCGIRDIFSQIPKDIQFAWCRTGKGSKSFRLRKWDQITFGIFVLQIQLKIKLKTIHVLLFVAALFCSFPRVRKHTKCPPLLKHFNSKWGSPISSSGSLCLRVATGYFAIKAQYWSCSTPSAFL